MGDGHETASEIMTGRDLTFHIIFVPGTVPFLCVAARSLLKHSPYRLRLVANGLDGEELARLEAFSRINPRLEFFAYPTPVPLEHGTLLTLLFHRQDDEFFCFADSDVFASGPFHQWLEKKLEDADVVASCSALLWEDLPPSPGFLGRCTRTPAGTRNMGSYFAVYRTRPVSEAMRETGIGFEKRTHELHVTSYERELLKAEGWTGGPCDTGNLLCYELRKRDCRLVHHDDDSLLHIGGVSWWLLKKGRQPGGGKAVLRDGDLGLTGQDSPVPGEDRLAVLLARRKEARAEWFAAFLYHLFGLAPEPELAVTDAVVRERVLNACADIRNAYGSVADWRF